MATYQFDNFSGGDLNAQWATMLATVIPSDIVEFTSGATYNVTTILELDSLEGITLTTTSTARALFVAASGVNLNGIMRANFDVANLTINNLHFDNQDATIGSPTQAANLRFEDGVFDNITVTNCYFTAAGQSNGMKVYVTTNQRDFASNFLVNNNTFENLGQMGMEFVNHRDDIFENDFSDGYSDIVFTNNTINNVGTVAFGMGISMSGQGRRVTVSNNRFNDCPTTAVEFIGTDDSLVEDNTFSGTTQPYNLVSGGTTGFRPARVNDNNVIRNNSGNVSLGSTFINATNITVENDVIVFGDGFFGQGVQNVTFNNCIYVFNNNSYGITFRSGDSAGFIPATGNRIDNSRFENLGTAAVVTVESTHGDADLEINCSELRIPSGSTWATGLNQNGNTSTITYNNTERYSGGTLQDTQNAAGANNCAIKPANLATGSNAKRRIPTNVVTAASRGITYDDFGFDNGPIIEQMAIDMWNGVFDAVVFESGRTVNFETSAEWFHSNVPSDSVGGGIWYTDGAAKVIFYSDNNICTLMTTTPGVGPINWTFDNIRFEHAFNGTLTGCGTNNSSASIISFHHSDNGGSRNVWFEDCEFTAPNCYTDGFSAFSQAIDGIVDYTFKDCNFNNTGRMLFEVFGQRAGDLTTYFPPTDAYVKRFTLEGGSYTDGGLIGELGISIVQSFYDLKLDGIATANSAAQIEIGVTHAYIKDVVATGTGDAGWFAGIYDDFNTPLFIQSDYVFENYQVNVSDGIEFFGGVRDVTVNNSTIEIDDRWWNLNTYGTFTINNSDLKLGDDGSNLIELQLDKADFVFNNTEIEKLTNTNLFEDRSVVTMNCVNVLLTGSETFTSTGYAGLNDVQEFNDGTPGTEYGDTGGNCGVIGYVVPSESVSITSNTNIIYLAIQ